MTPKPNSGWLGWMTRVLGARGRIMRSFGHAQMQQRYVVKIEQLLPGVLVDRRILCNPSMQLPTCFGQRFEVRPRGQCGVDPADSSGGTPNGRASKERQR